MVIFHSYVKLPEGTKAIQSPILLVHVFAGIMYDL